MIRFFIESFDLEKNLLNSNSEHNSIDAWGSIGHDANYCLDWKKSLTLSLRWMILQLLALTTKESKELQSMVLKAIKF